MKLGSNNRSIYFYLYRHLVQITIALMLLWAGYKFYHFVLYLETFGATNYVARPPIVEAFLPISALLSLKLFLTTGFYDTIHPAGLTVFILILLISLIFRRAFCSWLCPIGALSEALQLLGQRYLVQFKLPFLVDRCLMVVKYLLLGFFVKVIIFDMSVVDVALFLQSPYNRIADVKMLKFFLEMSKTTAVVLLVLFILSIFIKNFWCRYLCPYGALLGLIGFLSPLIIKRDDKSCINCQICTKACANGIKVAELEKVSSPECNACLNCVHACPQKGALTLRFAMVRISPRVLEIGILIILFGGILLAKAKGLWETSLTMEDYQSLIQNLHYWRHP